MNSYNISLENVINCYNETLTELNSVKFTTESQAWDSVNYWEKRLKIALQPIDVFFPKNDLVVFRNVIPTVSWDGSYWFLKGE